MQYLSLDASNQFYHIPVQKPLYLSYATFLKERNMQKTYKRWQKVLEARLHNSITRNSRIVQRGERSLVKGAGSASTRISCAKMTPGKIQIYHKHASRAAPEGEASLVCHLLWAEFEIGQKQRRRAKKSNFIATAKWGSAVSDCASEVSHQFQPRRRRRWLSERNLHLAVAFMVKKLEK